MTTTGQVTRVDLQASLRQLLPGVKLETVSSDNLTLAWVEATAGASVPQHFHKQEQLTVIVSGRVRVTTGAGRFDLSGGQAICIPSNVPHEAEVLADAVYLDIFHPVRTDLV